MFTGIVDHCGQITSITRNADCATVWIQCQFDGLQLGESIAIDGACLTVTDTKPNAFACEISPETLHLTIARCYEEGQPVNLERALRLNERLGGHLVSGHIDDTVAIESVEKHNEFLQMNLCGVTDDNYHYLVPKGSVAINGVSLTINEVTHDGFTVMLIPHTLERTNLHELRTGHAANMEFDLVAKMIAKQVQPYLDRIRRGIV